MKTLLLSALGLCLSTAGTTHATPPNVVYVLCDDLGYGDLQCLNPHGKIKTPHLDRLAAGGMVFTDAHSGSSVCTPTRYGILTGRYSWRSKLQSGVLGGLSPRLIEPGRLTVAQFLKDHGYHTAIIGKWHLGLDWAKKEGRSVSELGIESTNQVDSVDYSRPFENGPTRVGFDSFYGISGSLDMVPFVFLENDHVTQLPTVEKKWIRKGPAAPDFEAVDVLPTLTKKASEYIKARAAEPRKPFFLYLPLTSPHTPIVPSPEWAGKSGISPYADFVMQTDDAIGRLLSELDAQGISQNTLVIVTSDNGCSPAADIPALLEKGHSPNLHFRGHKADIFDGGHRIPFLVRWPAKVKAGGKSDQIICLTDLLATTAEIVGASLPENAAEDSVSFLPALLGTDKAPLREAVVHHSINGSFAIRQAHWKLELCPDSGGWSDPKPGTPKASELPPVQLYDLSKDIEEKTNVQKENPEVVAHLTKLLQKYVESGRSTPGAPQQNAVPVEMVKPPKAPAAKGKKQER
ncbi:MAG: Arylsulfatase [Verrucomicrobiota bacterium]